MKTKKYILFALAALLTASCHDDGNWGQKPWEQYDPTYGIEANGNQNLRATNPKSIADVKAMFSKEISGGSLRQVTEPLQIQGIVVGNDEGGNIYQSLYIQDATGAISISISQAGLFGPLYVSLQMQSAHLPDSVQIYLSPILRLYPLCSQMHRSTPQEELPSYS